MNNNFELSNFFLNVNKSNFIIHFVGIGGNGMSGIAEFLFLSGYKITGSDIKINNKIKYLSSLGIKIYNYHSKKNILNVNLVVYSSAINIYNSEIISAYFYNIPVVKRIEILNELVKFYYPITIIGTHGKSTTTALAFDILCSHNLKVNCINGDIIKSINSNIYLSNSKYFLLEMDESDKIFLNFRPSIVILTNVDIDHLNNYDNKFDNLIYSFITYLNYVPFYGFIIACIDDPIVKKILDNNIFKCKIITYGFDCYANYRIDNFIQKENSSFFDLFVNNKIKVNFNLNMFGKHNVLNTVASISLLDNLKKIDYSILKNKISTFKGIYRRSEYIGNFFLNYKNIFLRNILIFFDYGHHPTEINLNLNAIKNSFLNRRLVMIFQPHRYTRTISLLNKFVLILSKLDVLLLLEIYSSGENNVSNISSFNIISNIYDTYGYINSFYVENKKKIFFYLINLLKDNDIIIFQGAGETDILLSNFYLKYLKKKLYEN